MQQLLRKLVAISRGYWNKWSAKLESDRFFLLVPWYFPSIHSLANEKKYTQISSLVYSACQRHSPHSNSALEILVFRSIDSMRTETNTYSIHRLLDYGDYEEMKEFSIFIRCTAVTAMATVICDDTHNNPSQQCWRAWHKKKEPQCFAFLFCVMSVINNQTIFMSTTFLQSTKRLPSLCKFSRYR